MRYTVIGLGQFGLELCKELAARNIDVVAVALKGEDVTPVKELVTYSCTAEDITSVRAFDNLELTPESHVIVAIGGSFQENLLVVTHLQQMGIRNIYARVIDPVHEYILGQMDVLALINLSRVASKQLASQLESPEFLRVSPMDDEHSIIEIGVPHIWIGRQLKDVGLRTEHRLNLLTVRRGEAQTPQGLRELLTLPRVPVIGTPEPNLTFEENDILVLFGRNANLSKFAQIAKGL